MIHITQSSLKEITEIFNRRKATIHLENYTVGELLDHGGMSNVYRLIDSDGSTDYVLRVSEERKSSYSNDIFNVREMEILSELKKNSQPHVVQYLDAFVADNPGHPRYYCSVMKFLSTLKKYQLNGDGVEIAVRLGCDFLPLLQSFMEKEILHRDIKPENIFYDGDFRNDTGFLLGDFGIAKRDTETSVTPTGTETTMAPEVRGLDRSLGKDRTYSDMYSLGIVMYRYLNQGVYPSNRERIDKMPPDRKPFPEPRYGSKRLKALVLKATSYDPRDRFESPQDMLRELQQCEEYGTYFIHGIDATTSSGNVTEYIHAENERLRAELAEKEKERRSHQLDLNRLKLRIQRLNEGKVNSEQEAEKLKQQSAEREQELLNEIDLLRRQSTEREQELLNEIGLLKQQAADYEAESSQNVLKNIFYSLKNKKALVFVIAFSLGLAFLVLIAFTIANVPISLENLKEGDSFTFGNYKQGANGEVQPIAWRVLEVDDGKALVISEKLLDYDEYNEINTNVTWEGCSIRHWMNNDFINSAFSEDERTKILSTSNTNPDNSQYGTDGGHSTTDKIFLFSVDEAERYFSSDSDRVSLTSDFAHAKGHDANNRADWWWLRTPGYKNDFAACVNFEGVINQNGNRVNYSNIAIRPAFWLNIE